MSTSLRVIMKIKSKWMTTAQAVMMSTKKLMTIMWPSTRRFTKTIMMNMFFRMVRI